MTCILNDLMFFAVLHTKGCIEPDRCHHIYLLIDSRHVFNWTASFVWFFLVKCFEQSIPFMEKSLILSLPTAVNGTILRAVMKIDADFNMNGNACTRANRFLASIAFHEIYLFVMIMGFIWRNMNNNFLFKFIFCILPIVELFHLFLFSCCDENTNVLSRYCHQFIQ